MTLVIAAASNPDSFWIYPWVVVFGVCLGWFFDNRQKCAEVTKFRDESLKFKAEVNKLEIEQVKLAGDTLREVQRARSSYSDACAKCTHAVQELLVAIENEDKLGITSSRDRFCEALTRDAILALCGLIEWECLSRKLSPDKLRVYILNDVVPELKRLTDWVVVINYPMFLEGFGLERLTISERTLRPIIDCDRFLAGDDVSAVRPVIFQATRMLQDA